MINVYTEMNKNYKSIGEEILEKERECLTNFGRGVEQASFGGKYENQYYAKVEDNLWHRTLMAEQHFKEYSRGSGGELDDKNGRPAKMKSIRSSSAMTYNLLGDRNIKLIDGKEIFSEGQYSIEYEKQLYTIRRNLQPANLDAFLYNEEKQEAIFCEMKMMEWIFNEPRALKDAYQNQDLYYANTEVGNKTVAKFLKAIENLKKEMPEFKDGAHFYRYDAWQMFKHILGIYNMTSDITREEMNRKIAKSTDDFKLIPPCKKVTLVNVVFEPAPEAISEEMRTIYKEIVEKERTDFFAFKTMMKESGIPEAFDDDCHIKFDIEYMSAAEFMDCFDVSERREYLERYRLAK
ncbi:MAG: hypothetical protein IJZ23_04410 [Roseburia sp.]|nr:hypothetical protein [Roseburia sp.]